MRLGEVKEHPQAHTAPRGGQILDSGDQGDLKTKAFFSTAQCSLTHEAPRNKKVLC